ncbi:cupredoxin domain-containing protein [Chelativorans sp. Marseille-P2723]|uniref:cupredoxin domain-containing protein n=1 Tax=Chelativorans sp. Marseille-P2723 TaxID=2709133 RepID=UPI00156D95D1|nr:cupredoxin domain-containing protein [Chelativorans sp. Marseille-P2723]
MKAILHRRQLLFAGGAAVLAGGIPARAHNGTVHVTIENLTFQPAQIEVRAGETIEWINKDRMPHTATVRDKWEVMIPPGQTATRQAEVGDTVDYYCRFHPNMTGRITIVG